MEFYQLCRRIILVAVLFVAIASSASVQVSKIKRAVTTESLASKIMRKHFCHSKTPCGWSVYIPFDRTVQYFMKNVCDCSVGKSCLFSHDDVSVSAYVHRCRVDANPDEADTEPPT